MTKRFFVLFGLMMCAGAVSADPLLDGDAEAGQQKAAVCAACHGPKGNMESAQFPKLAGQGAPYIYEQLKLFKSGERNNAIMMGQASGLSDADMKNLAVYFAAQQTKPGVADETIAPAGAVLYHGGNPDKNTPACAGCHGPSGLGNAAAKFPHLSGQNPQYIVTQLTAYRDGTRSGYRNATIMNGVAERLSDADIKALASYVSGLAPSDGKGGGNGHGALMQGVGGPGAAAGNAAGAGAAAGGQSPSSDDQSGEQPPAAAGQDEAGQSENGNGGGEQAAPKPADQADAAAKQKADAAAGTENGANAEGGSDNASSDGSTDTSGDGANASADNAGDNSQP
ncbi:c-type cytochrome [Salinisphaera sp. T31B1]|uniref:c-type cytochrome n=1 Tax=Salinisphaera sp. T31B1 TaxID=727963 RepID=UPI0033408A24